MKEHRPEVSDVDSQEEALHPSMVPGKRTRVGALAGAPPAVATHAAMTSGWFGGDEAIVGAELGGSPEHRLAVEADYRRRYGVELRDDITAHFSGATRERLLGVLGGDQGSGEFDPLGSYAPRGIADPDPASGIKLRVSAAVATIAPSVVRGMGRKQMDLDAFSALRIPAAPLPVPAFTPPEGITGHAPTGGAIAGDQPVTARALRQAYLAKQTTPTEVAQRFLDAQRASDGGAAPLRAFIDVQAADVLAQAAASTERYRAGRSLSEIDGVPIAVKGQLDVSGYVTTGGASIAGKAPATRDAAVVANLRRQGALIVGTTNMHELGYGVRGENPQFGAALNPYNTDHLAGGSSGGSAAAVAGGLVPMAVGSDAGGSIRIPAAHTGVVGLKPTYGLLSQRGNMPLAPSLQSAGPIAATAADAATMLEAMAGPGKVDLSRVGDTHDLSDITIGVVREWNRHADAQIVDATNRAIAALAARGAKIREVEIRGLNLAGTAQMATFSTEVSAMAKAEPGLAPSAEVTTKLAAAKAVTSEDMAQVHRLRGFLAAEMQRVLGEVDLILSPTTGKTAPRHDPSADKTGSLSLADLDATARFTTLANLTGLPAVSFPAGYDREGMPIGVQAIGRAYGDGTILRIAAAGGEALERRKPAQSTSLLGGN